MIVYIPIRGPEIEECNVEFNRFLSDFKNQTNTEDIKLLLDSEEKFRSIKNIEFNIIYSSEDQSSENETIKSLKEKYSFFNTQLVHYFLSIKLEFKNPYYENEDSYAGVTIDFIVAKLSLIIHLTYASKIDFLNGVIFSNKDDYLDKTSVLLSSLDYAYQHALKINWPRIQGLKLHDTVSWYISNNIHTDDNSKSRLHRAINAFSYQFSMLLEKDTSILFWTMVGIETLLAEGNTNIINQIKNKSSIILGEPKEYKKKLDKLYNYRSRFVHGDINFPAKFSSDYDNFEEEYYEYWFFSTSILISLIRHLITNKKSEYQFEYKLK